MILENGIVDLMAYYRAKWPDQWVTPKLHLLEDYALEFIENWGALFGLYGEQGIEGLHSTFNKMKMIYVSMNPPSKRLEATLKEHFMQVNPDSAVLRSTLMKRKNLTITLIGINFYERNFCKSKFQFILQKYEI